MLCAFTQLQLTHFSECTHNFTLILLCFMPQWLCMYTVILCQNSTFQHHITLIKYIVFGWMDYTFCRTYMLRVQTARHTMFIDTAAIVALTICALITLSTFATAVTASAGRQISPLTNKSY